MKNLMMLFFVLCLVGCIRKNPNTNLIVDGKKEGIHITMDSLGRLEIATYQNGLLHGEYILYHEGNNRIMVKELYDMNIENGPAYYFYSSGAMQYSRNWKSGKKVGYGVDYYETGETEAVMIYNEDGFLVLRNTFDKNGKVLKKEKAQGK